MGQDDPSVKTVSIEVPASMQAAVEQLIALGTGEATLKQADDLARDEQEVYAATDALGHLILEQRWQAAVNDAPTVAAGRDMAKSDPRRVKDQGHRPVHVMTMRGGIITLRTVYYSRNCDARKTDRRGFYPVLLLWGIHGRRRYYSPALVKHVATLTAAMGSIDEARRWLHEIGIDLCVATIQRMTHHISKQFRRGQQLHDMAVEHDLTGRRVVVSVDGGRIRIRRKKRGRKTKKGRDRYHTDWREPKLMIIYVIDESGRIDRTWAPLIDGQVIGDKHAPDAIFSMLQSYLEALRIEQADRVLFVADGACWIWRRVDSLRRALNLRQEQFVELVDFYHAVEHLAKVAELKRTWTSAQRKKWIHKRRHQLRNGKIEEVIAEIDTLCRGRKSKKIRTEQQYFHKNLARMDYLTVANEKLPIGSGAIESAIRRVVNLRLKGAGIFWYEESANAMLLLRCYYKAGRTDDLLKLAFARPLEQAA